MRALLLTSSPDCPVASLQFADQQILAGPNCPNVQTMYGEWLSLRTDRGCFDLATVLARIPDAQAPDVLVHQVGKDWQDRVRNVAAFHGLKLLVVAPVRASLPVLRNVFAQLSTETYDRVVFVDPVDQERFLSLAEFRAQPEWRRRVVVQGEESLSTDFDGQTLNVVSL